MTQACDPFALANPEHEHFRQTLIDGRRREVTTHSLWPSDKCGDDHLVMYQCVSFTEAFEQRFPGLRRVAGFYNGIEHWWLVDVEGNIIDPTRAQFGTAPGEYSTLEEGKYDYRIGACPDCGIHIYSKDTVYEGGFCTPECARNFAAYMLREIVCCEEGKRT